MNSLSSTSATILSDSKAAMSVDNDTTWIERFAMNLLSYSLVLAPIAFVVIVTKYKLCPTSFHSNTIVQWFVYGCDFSSAIKNLRPIQNNDDFRMLLDDNETTKNKSSNNSSTFTFIWCLIGLQISYLSWGFLQEKIMTTEYPLIRINDLNNTLNKLNNPGPSTNVQTVTFHDSQFLVFLNRIFAFITAIIALVISRQRRKLQTYTSSKFIASSIIDQDSIKPPAPLYEYIYCSLSNILSSWCQYEALKYVNFPTQCLSKSCKVIPVMLMSRLLLRKRYQLIDYICALLLAVGMFIFMLNQPFRDGGTNRYAHKQDDEHSTGHHIIKANSTLLSGLTILVLYLTFDSFTSNWQSSLYGRYGISNWQMMAAINFYSILLTLTSLHQLGNLRPAFHLLASSSLLLRDCILMSIMSSVGQMFVYYTIKRFGPVLFAVIMTLRQFLSILISYMTYHHKLNFGSSAGLLLVFLVVIYQVWYKSKKKTSTRLN